MPGEQIRNAPIVAALGPIHRRPLPAGARQSARAWPVNAARIRRRAAAMDRSRGQIVGALKSRGYAYRHRGFSRRADSGGRFVSWPRCATTSIPLRLQGLRRVPMLTRIFVDTSRRACVAEVARRRSRSRCCKANWTSTTLDAAKIRRHRRANGRAAEAAFAHRGAGDCR